MGQQDAGVTQEYSLRPPGPIHRLSKFCVARFTVPSGLQRGDTTWQVAPDKPDVGIRRPKEKTRPPLALLHGGETVQRGVLEGGATGLGTAAAERHAFGGHAASFFVLIKQGNSITAHPADQYINLRPVMRRGGAATLEEVEAAAAISGRGRGAGGTGSAVELRMVPKSERIKKEEAQGNGGKPVSFGRDKLYGGLFGDSDSEDGGSDGGGRKGARGAKGGKGGAATGRRGGNRKKARDDDDDEDGGGGGGDDEGGDEQRLGYGRSEGDVADEMLRPEKPEGAEDWEHEVENADDDVDMGDDEVAEDNPGERKRFGIDDEDEEDGDLDENGLAVQKLLKAEDELEAAAATVAEELEDGDDAGAAPVDDDDLEDDLDDLAEQEVGAISGSIGKALQGPPPPAARRATPPPPAIRRSTPPPAPAVRRETPPPAAAAPGDAAKRGRDAAAEDAPAKRQRPATPPPASMVKAASPAPAGLAGPAPAGAAAAPAPAAAAPAPAGGDALAVSVERVSALLSQGPVPLDQLSKAIKPRNKEEMDLFKKLVLQIGKMEVINGVRHVSLKSRAVK